MVKFALVWLFIASNALANQLASLEQFKHITFKDIPATDYSIKDHILTASVHSSSSALLFSLDKVTCFESLSVEWQLNGKVNTNDPKVEQSKAGDDFPLRIGLMIHGKAPFVPFFASAWIKAVRDYLKFPSQTMQYYILGSASPAGTTWESPYTSSISNTALASVDSGDGWKKSSTPLSNLSLVGYWLMADGDNTQSQFTARMRAFKLSECVRKK